MGINSTDKNSKKQEEVLSSSSCFPVYLFVPFIDRTMRCPLAKGSEKYSLQTPFSAPENRGEKSRFGVRDNRQIIGTII